MKAPDPIAIILAAILAAIIGFGGFFLWKIGQCNRPGFLPHGCPIVIQIGR